MNDYSQTDFQTFFLRIINSNKFLYDNVDMRVMLKMRVDI